MDGISCIIFWWRKFFFFSVHKKLLTFNLIRHKHKQSNYVSQRAVKRTKKNCCSQDKFTFKHLTAFLLSQCFVYCASYHYIKATVKCRLFCLQLLCVSRVFSRLAVWAALFNSVYSLGTDNADGKVRLVCYYHRDVQRCNTKTVSCLAPVVCSTHQSMNAQET